MKTADKFNNFSIYGVFLITLTNFLISAFSGANTSIHPVEIMDDASEVTMPDT